MGIQRFAKSALLGVVGLAALVLSPFSACLGPSFNYGADEMRAAVEGTWQIEVAATATAPVRDITVALRQSAKLSEEHSERSHLVREAAACGTRSLVRNAGACTDVSEMPLDVTIVAGLPAGTRAEGTFGVAGTSFESGSLHLTAGDFGLEAKIFPSGSVGAAWTIDRATVTLTRLPK